MTTLTDSCVYMLQYVYTTTLFSYLVHAGESRSMAHLYE